MSRINPQNLDRTYRPTFERDHAGKSINRVKIAVAEEKTLSLFHCGTFALYAMALLATPTVCGAALEPAALPFAVTRTLAPGLLRTLAVLRRF